ncbi:MAG: hypothetical protein COX57_05315 [Alphaproteobacteria bacterium CG_4_10_14_0_2_um_filter_63_37]|nr:MAG: hypothetical protein AUJ55_02935 [Proteobacteria bacterium CG1_02_64_396]PJA25046.1 MAG: hypothetical protein COX57_05315 [Alphaproteobacteria bacterium CG_4_10_14_0_2_um_filter_63_37]
MNVRVVVLAGLALSATTLLSGCGHSLNEAEWQQVQADRTALAQYREEANKWAAERKRLVDDRQAARQETTRIAEEKSRVESDAQALAMRVQDLETAQQQAPVSQVQTILEDDGMFLAGSADLSASGIKRLKEIAAALKQTPEGQEIVVVGHTDTTPPGSAIKDQIPDNWALSSARAASVIRYLVWGQGMDPNRFVLVGRSSTWPVADNATPEGRKANQRVVIQVRPVEGQPTLPVAAPVVDGAMESDETGMEGGAIVPVEGESNNEDGGDEMMESVGGAQ